MERVIKELVKLPGIGEKTAMRLAFHLTKADRNDVEGLAHSLLSLREDLRTCSTCCALAGSDPCELCSDPRRSDEIVCVVEEAEEAYIVAERVGPEVPVDAGRVSPVGERVVPDDSQFDVSPALAQ